MEKKFFCELINEYHCMQLMTMEQAVSNRKFEQNLTAHTNTVSAPDMLIQISLFFMVELMRSLIFCSYIKK